MNRTFSYIGLAILMASTVSACKDFVEVGPPKTELELSEAFKEDNSATSAVLGIYINMLRDPSFINSGITIYGGLSADELGTLSTESEQLQFQDNALVPANATIGSMWSAAYTNLVLINTCLEGLQSSHTLSAAVKEQLIGESKFSRAFINFYLVNLWEHVPLVNTSDWRENAVVPQSNKDEIYAAIVSDLKEAKDLLKDAYPTDGKVRPNKWAASALLARAYLYQENYEAAAAEASEVIASGIYGPLPALDQAFLAESPEAIWQLMPSRNIVITTQEGYNFIGDVDMGASPNYRLQDDLLQSFEAGDQRKTSWINSVVYNDQTYYYPFKYKDRGDYNASTVSEYYIMLRLSEQYLIRAEARTQLGDLDGAVEDIDVIRTRAGLASIRESLSTTGQASLNAALETENRHEFFAEWGHRWLDLKRTGRIDALMSAAKDHWKPSAALFPIPQNEIELNYRLQQNTGY